MTPRNEPWKAAAAPLLGGSHPVPPKPAKPAARGEGALCHPIAWLASTSRAQRSPPGLERGKRHASHLGPQSPVVPLGVQGSLEGTSIPDMQSGASPPNRPLYSLLILSRAARSELQLRAFSPRFVFQGGERGAGRRRGCDGGSA